MQRSLTPSEKSGDSSGASKVQLHFFLLFAGEPEIEECCQVKDGCEQDHCAEQLRIDLRVAVGNQGAFAGDF